MLERPGMVTVVTSRDLSPLLQVLKLYVALLLLERQPSVI